MDRHEEDRAFLKELRKFDERRLAIFLEFQACEAWKRIAIEREIVRRSIPGSSNRQDTRL